MRAQPSFPTAGLATYYGDLTPQPCARDGIAHLSRTERDAADKAFRDGLTAVTPALRAFAISMVRDLDRADDLVQDTLLKAWANRHRYEEGTNFRGWMFVILRNALFSQYRR